VTSMNNPLLPISHKRTELLFKNEEIKKPDKKTRHFRIQDTSKKRSGIDHLVKS